VYSEALPALAEFFQWPTPLFLLLGTALGIMFGILPGLGGPQAVALLLPVAITLPESAAIAMVIGAMGAIPVSGSLSAILINTPGTGQSAATLFDGFPLTRQGKAGVAIGAACVASLMGALFGAIILTLILPLGRQIVLSFSYPEYFMLVVLGLSVIAVVIRGSMIKGLIAASLGLLLASVGYDPITGELRYTFGWNYLYEGIGLIPALVGLFAVSEAVYLFERRDPLADAGAIQGATSGLWEGALSVFRNFALFLRSSVIGTVIGIIPGVGGAVANFVAYGQAVQTARDSSEFGKGDVRGVIAPEAANNAKDGGALIPTLIFGIPGSLEMVVLLGALTLFGLQPGPRLILDDPGAVITVIYALVAANVLASVAGLIMGGPLTRATVVPGNVMAPVIMVVALIGVYAADGRIQDLIVTLAFGVLGFLMRRFGFPLVPLIIALVLGELLQTSYYQMLSTTGLSALVTRPISLGLLLITLALLVAGPILKERKRGG
jgi:putative tricarboxylic transport membrane protein